MQWGIPCGCIVIWEGEGRSPFHVLVRMYARVHRASTRFRIIAAATLSAREVIRRTIDFLRANLSAGFASAPEGRSLIRQTAPKSFRVRPTSKGLKVQEELNLQSC